MDKQALRYNLDYYENLLRIYSKSAEAIAGIRWLWIRDVWPKRVLDYGCGVGWFRAHRPKGVEVDTYDIGPYPQTGIRTVIYDVVCFWDVLEHLPGFEAIEPVLALARYAAATVPILPERAEYAAWKHFKPGEHLHYWSHETFTAFFKRYGFELVKSGTPECPPRQDVHSFLFRKKETV